MASFDGLGTVALSSTRLLGSARVDSRLTASTEAETAVRSAFAQHARELLAQQAARNDALQARLPQGHDPVAFTVYRSSGLLDVASAVYLDRIQRRAEGTDAAIPAATGFGANAVLASQQAIQGFLDAYSTVTLLGGLPAATAPTQDVLAPPASAAPAFTPPPGVDAGINLFV